MSPANPRPLEFAMLGEPVAEEAGEEDDGSCVERLRVQRLWRALVWIVCSSLALYTTKQLLTTHEFHYPYTISCQVFASILAVYVSVVRFYPDKGQNISHRTHSRWALRRPCSCSNGELLVMLPASLIAAASLPMLLQGLLHMPSLPVLVMLFPLAYAAESVVLFLSSTFCRTRYRLPFETGIAVVASTIVLYNEYRLEVPGLIMGVTGVLFLGVWRALFTIGSARVESELAIQSGAKVYHGFTIITLVLGTLISGSLALYVERFGQYSWSIEVASLMMINLALFLGTTLSGSSILVYSPIYYGESKAQFSNIPIQALDLYASLMSSLLIIVVVFHSGFVSVSWVQIAAFLFGAVCLGGFDQIHSLVLLGMDNTHDKINKSFRIESNETRRPTRCFTGMALSLVLTIVAWTLASFSSVATDHLFPGFPSTLDTLYIPSTRFEIVVSMYNEDPDEVRSMLDKFKSTDLLSKIHPHITIYTKNPDHDLREIKNVTGANRVERLENLGREGGTYLWHMVNNWDSLASQTMFVQAHAHNMRELIPRIDSYLAPETGFLSLGFAGITCNCGTCTDRWGWTDKSNVIPKLYRGLYGEDCEEETPVQLTFKGQFVASARRIRGIDRKIYEGLLDTITKRKEGSEKVAIKQGGVTGIDTPDNPYFGFTMERIWGLLMQCGTNQRIATKCPSLLSGMSIGGKPGDCGCLDIDV